MLAHVDGHRGAWIEFVDCEIEVAMNRAPFRSLAVGPETEVELSRPCRHSVHRQVSGLGEAMGQSLLSDMSYYAVDLLKHLLHFGPQQDVRRPFTQDPANRFGLGLRLPDACIDPCAPVRSVRRRHEGRR